MSQTIVISAEALIQVSAYLKVPAATLQAAVDKFNAAVAAIGPVWGDDDIGQEWAKIYTPGLADVQKGFDDIIKAFIQLADDFKLMGVVYHNTEQANLS